MSAYDESYAIADLEKEFPRANASKIRSILRERRKRDAKEWAKKREKEHSTPLTHCPTTGLTVAETQAEINQEGQIAVLERDCYENKRLEEFRETWGSLQREVTRTATDKGFNSEEFAPCTALLLMHAELSEIAEALRIDDPPDNHCPSFPSSAVEFADLIIRLMVYAEVKGLDIPAALWAKKEYNKSRPFKHGKKF